MCIATSPRASCWEAEVSFTGTALLCSVSLKFIPCVLCLPYGFLWRTSISAEGVAVTYTFHSSLLSPMGFIPTSAAEALPCWCLFLLCSRSWPYSLTLPPGAPPRLSPCPRLCALDRETQARVSSCRPMGSPRPGTPPGRGRATAGHWGCSCAVHVLNSCPIQGCSSLPASERRTKFSGETSSSCLCFPAIRVCLCVCVPSHLKQDLGKCARLICGP